MVRGLLLAFGLAVQALHAQTTFVETFETGQNEGGWSFGAPGESLQGSGGNPGAYLHAPLVDTFAPQPRTALGLASEFNGDFRGEGVILVGIDLVTFDADFSTGGRPLSVILVSDNQTPGNFDDDWGAYTIGPDNIPNVGEGWRSYELAVPSQLPALPAGWSFIQFGSTSPPPDWNALITDVAQLRFFYGDPENFFIFQQWDLGLDNPRIAKATADPGRVPPTVRLARVSPAEIRISWSQSPCSPVDYGIYEGMIGSWYSHKLSDCHDDGSDLTEIIAASPGSTYYLVVPLDSEDEGSYGFGLPGNERPRGLSVCVPSQALGCP